MNKYDKLVKKKPDVKEDIARRICKAARYYKKHLVGKTFLVCHAGTKIEVRFKTENFAHLCGVQTNLLAEDFFRLACHRRLTGKMFYFDKQHNRGTVEKKVLHLTKLEDVLLGGPVVCKQVETKTKVHDIGLNCEVDGVHLLVCFNRVKNSPGSALVPCSFRIEELPEERCMFKARASLVFVKDTDDRFYTDCVYGEVTDRSSLSKKIQKKLGESVRLIPHNSREPEPEEEIEKE